MVAFRIIVFGAALAQPVDAILESQEPLLIPLCEPCTVGGGYFCSAHNSGLGCFINDEVKHATKPPFTGVCARDVTDACHTCGMCGTLCGNCIIADQSKGPYEPLDNQGDCESGLICKNYVPFDVPYGDRARLGQCVEEPAFYMCSGRCQACVNDDEDTSIRRM